MSARAARLATTARSRVTVMTTQILEPLTVLHVLAPAAFGGLEQVVVTLATGQQSRGCSVHVAAIVGTNSAELPMMPPLRAAGVTVHKLAFPGRAYRAQLVALQDLCARVSPDVIHTHGYLPDFLGALLHRPSRRTALVTTVHGFTGGGLKNRLYEALQRRTFGRFDAVVAVSRKLATQLARGDDQSERIRTIPNACAPMPNVVEPSSARQVLGIPEGGFTVGWVGRISPEKGLDILIHALALLRDVPVRLTVVGDGSEKNKMQALADQLSVAPRIAWAGVVTDVSQLLGAFDVLVISSRTEGTPIILLEGMSAGVPIVTTAVGGIPDVVSGSEAILVDTSPEAVAKGIREVYRNPQAARGRAVLAKELVRSAGGIDDWLARYESVYASARAGKSNS